MTVRPLISLRNVGAAYDDGKEVLADVSFDIYDADFVLITGPNGGGKTTLVKIITRLLPHSTGTVEYADNLTVGYLPQQNIFDRTFPISVLDVVVSGLQSTKRFPGRYTSKDFARARKLLEATSISHLEKRPIGNISGGQMQRALLCRALISDPKVLILDEPTTYVDQTFEAELYTLLRRLNSDTLDSPDTSGTPATPNAFGTPGKAIVIVSHDTTTLAPLAKRIIHIA